MASELATVHQENLLLIEGFCRRLGEALSGAGFTPEQAHAVWQTSIWAECVLCGIRVSGEELFGLSQAPSPVHGTRKLGRLRLGDCARHGCDSLFYRITFENYPRLHWPTLINQIEEGRRREAQPAEVRSRGIRLPSFSRLKYDEFSGLARRAIVVIAVALALVAVRQVYHGGRIPLIREPENFHVDTGPDPAPNGAEPLR